MIKPSYDSITSRVPRSFRISTALAVVSLALALTACEARLDVDAPAPAMMADADTLPSLPTSTLDIPLTLDLTPVVSELDNAVPRKIGNNDERNSVSNKRLKIARSVCGFAHRNHGANCRRGSLQGAGLVQPPYRPRSVELMRHQRCSAASKDRDLVEYRDHS